MKTRKTLIFNLIPISIAVLYVIQVILFDNIVLDLLSTSLMMAYWSLGGIYLAIANSMILGKNIRALVFSLGVLWGITGIYCGLWSLLKESDSFGLSILLFITVYQSVSSVVAWSIMFIQNKSKGRKNEEVEKPKGKKEKVIIALNLFPMVFPIMRTLYIAVSQKIFFIYPLFIYPFEVIYIFLGGIYYTILNYGLAKKLGKKALGLSCLTLVFFQIANLLAFYAENTMEFFETITIYQWITLLISWMICEVVHRQKTKKNLS